MFYIPASSIDDWRLLLASPEKQWKDGYSAKELAKTWHNAKGFPESITKVFKESNILMLSGIDILVAFPEHKVPLPGGSRPSQNDIYILAKSGDDLVSITVEGKVSEPFGQTVSEWLEDASEGKIDRLGFLCEKIAVEKSKLSNMRYQLLHRTASAIIEAEKFNASHALMLVHSFSKENKGIEDYCSFAFLMGANNSKPNSIQLAKNIGGIDLYLGWVSEF